MIYQLPPLRLLSSTTSTIAKPTPPLFQWNKPWCFLQSHLYKCCSSLKMDFKNIKLHTLPCVYSLISYWWQQVSLKLVTRVSSAWIGYTLKQHKSLIAFSASYSWKNLAHISNQEISKFITEVYHLNLVILLHFCKNLLKNPSESCLGGSVV